MKPGEAMKIALVHYHLKRGGVSSVVLNQARALIRAGTDVLLVAGEAPAEDTGIPFALAEGLGYDSAPASAADGDAEKLASSIIGAIESRWKEGADIIHIHNPLIQKNSLLIPALKILIGRGLRLFLQNHDLAEDFRPDVYAGHTDYPENCHYGVINSRDYFYLRRSGLRTEGLHLIPNEVSPVKASPGLERTRYLYPVRAIRRKNIGEALLLSLFIPKGRTIAITLPPSEKDGDRYRRWTEFAAELGLPVEFGLGQSSSLQDLLGSAICALSTSVKEGFGFSFLEPWTAGRGLMGRRIDYVCRDFEESGVRFDCLYSSLEVPSEYIYLGSLKRKMQDAMSGIYASFGMQAPSHVMRIMSEGIVSRHTLDFGCLDEEFQESIIKILSANKAAKQDVAGMNPLLEQIGYWKTDEDLIEVNRQVILEQYGQERIVAILLGIYQSIMNIPVIHKISKQVLLDLYLDPLRLSLIGMSNG
jgi:glycosyltransferase involved in cell wall biosynthesis